MGYHFADCALLEPGDFVVPVQFRNSGPDWNREDVALPHPYGFLPSTESWGGESK